MSRPRKSSLRVLFHNLRPGSTAVWGGDTTQYTETAAELRSLGIDVDLTEGEFPTSVDGFDLVHLFNLQHAERADAATAVCGRRGTPIALSTIYWDLRSVERAAEVFRYHERAAARALAAVQPAVAAAVFHAKSAGVRRRSAHARERLLRASRLLLPNSVAELEILVSDFRAPGLRARAVVVPNGIAPPERRARAAAPCHLPDGPYVLQAGLLHPIKGQLQLIRALASSDYPIVFIGNGLDSVYGAACRAEGARRGRTWFFPAVPHDAMGAVYERARVHALPSLRESPGLASLEAAVHGASLVVSIHGPVQEYFGSDAHICDPEDLGSIRVAVDAAWRAGRPAALRARLLESFTWRAAAERTLAGYERLVAARD
jgi:glycosyltransferase involved in cell wall biosynthesis